MDCQAHLPEQSSTGTEETPADVRHAAPLCQLSDKGAPSVATTGASLRSSTGESVSA